MVLNQETQGEPTGSWDNFGTDAESERIKMCEEFHKWILKKRAELEHTVFIERRHMREVAPCARLALSEAPGPGAAPLSVIEFAWEALDALEHEGELELLNNYYRHMNECNLEQLSINDHNEGMVNHLWSWWLQEKQEAAAPASAAKEK